MSTSTKTNRDRVFFRLHRFNSRFIFSYRVQVLFMVAIGLGDLIQCSDLIETHVTMIHQITKHFLRVFSLSSSSDWLIHMHVHSIQSHVVWFDSIRKAITFEKEQVWLLLLHLTLNSIDYTTAFDNRSFHSFFLFRHSFQWAGALFEINHKCSSSAQRWQTHTHTYTLREEAGSTVIIYQSVHPAFR